MDIVLIIILIMAVVFFCILATYVVYPMRRTLEKTHGIEKKKGFLGDFDNYPAVGYTIPSFDGYVLHAQFIPAEENSDKYVILSHGYTYTRYGSVKYLNLFRRLGYHCIIYDVRGHGENVRAKCSLGLTESKDLMEVIADAYRRYGTDIFLGLHGESMGSGLQITALKYHPKVKFIVNDCGYAELVSVLRHKVKQDFHLPEWVVYPVSFMSRILYGYSFSQVRPIDSLAGNTIPICFVHGDSDRFIDCDHSRRMKEANPGCSELHIYPGADHACSYASDPERYFKMLSDFLKKVEKGGTGAESSRYKGIV